MSPVTIAILWAASGVISALWFSRLTRHFPYPASWMRTADQLIALACGPVGLLVDCFIAWRNRAEGGRQ